MENLDKEIIKTDQLIDKAIDKNVKKGFGLSLIDILVKQIKGINKIETKNGTRFVIEFDI